MRELNSAYAESLGIIPMPDETVHVYLTAGIAAELPVPLNANKVHFSCGVEFFIAEDDVAVLPTGTPTAGFRMKAQGHYV